MVPIEQLITNFFEWMIIINIGLLFFSAILVMALKNVLYKMHGKMFGVSEETIAVAVYSYLGLFKILIIVFNIVPYVALRLM